VCELNLTRTVGPTAAFRHEALLYGGKVGFLQAALPFIREGLRAEEPVMAVLEPSKIAWLREALGEDAYDVFFEDMNELGANPARLIAAWRRFSSAHPEEHALRGIGEPVYAGRSPEVLDECRRHEALLNLAFNGDRDIWMLCPYDTESLPEDVVEGARTTHPLVLEGGAEHTSDHYAHGAGTLAGELPPPPADADELRFGAGDGRAIRAFADHAAREHGLRPEGVESLVFAAGELAANTVLHGGGSGTIRSWAEHGSVVLEVRDAGHMDNPLVGRLRPNVDEARGRGLWLVNQLCDLVQIRSGTEGTVVRVRVSDRASVPAAV
jgi:anti-sigma regulatory factor (Ser/Thr protein kinase)